MKNDIRSISATVLLVLGFSKAAGRVEGSLAPAVLCSEGPTLFSISCNMP